MTPKYNSQPRGHSCCVMLVFIFLVASLDCVCASLQPVRRHQSSLQLVEGRLDHGGVTKLGSGPSGFCLALFLLSGDTCVVTGQLYGAALWTIWRWLVVAVRVNRQGLCGYITATLQRWMQHIKDREGHQYVCTFFLKSPVCHITAV